MRWRDHVSRKSGLGLLEHFSPVPRENPLWVKGPMAPAFVFTSDSLSRVCSCLQVHTSTPCGHCTCDSGDSTEPTPETQVSLWVRVASASVGEGDILSR